jgi:hypothetical protein
MIKSHLENLTLFRCPGQAPDGLIQALQEWDEASDLLLIRLQRNPETVSGFGKILVAPEFVLNAGPFLEVSDICCQSGTAVSSGDLRIICGQSPRNPDGPGLL